jgi:hypothetical protein
MVGRWGRGAILAAVLAAGVVAAPGGGSSLGGGGACPTKKASPGYVAAVDRVLHSGRDLWGEQLLATRGGPTYRAASGFLAPVLYGQKAKHMPLTSSGVYYLPLAFPTSVYGTTAFALHVADGSEIITRRLGGPGVSVWVGSRGRERYGSCVARLTQARLAGGWLPILETAYVDASGVRYRQQSFAGRVAGALSIVSFVRITVDARAARGDAVVRLQASPAGLTARGDRLVSAGATRLLVGSGGRFTDGAFQFRVAAGQSAVLYADWFHKPSAAPRLRADRATYEAARTRVSRFWEQRLSTGTGISLPEKVVSNAMRAVLVQQLILGWRYSLGNQYEEFSVAEGLDTAEVMAWYGFGDMAEGTLRLALDRIPRRPTAWRAGERLVAGAVYYRLFRDGPFLVEEMPVLENTLHWLEAAQIKTGPHAGRLQPEQLCSDVPQPVDGFTSQVVAWQGLLAMARVWSATGHPRLAEQARAVGLKLEAALRAAVRNSLVRLPDGSLFVPDAFSRWQQPYDRLSASRDGSYWNLVVPYGLASGFFRPGSAEARGLIRYLELHGSRLLGVTRADAHVLYLDPDGNSGLSQVYGLNVARFLADNDEPDQLVLSLYGMLTASMTPGTYVSGESVSVTPVDGAYYRKMFFPPNLGANSTFLDLIRLMLVQERTGSGGAPRGLDLAFSTPRSWLEDGKTIRVDGMPTSFGRLSFSIARHGSTVRVHVLAPATPRLRLRLRLPGGERIVDVRLGSRRLPFDARTATIDLTGRRGPLELRVVLS